MNCSIIDPKWIAEDKSGNIWCVDVDVVFDTLKEFGEVMLKCHITPAIFKECNRNKTSFLSIDYLCFDFDDGTLSQKIHDDCVIKHWNHLIVGSKNHLKDKNDGKGVIERFHLFIPLQKPITNPVLYRYSVEKLGKIMKWNIDQNAKDCCRYFYKHTQVLYCVDNLNHINGEWFSSIKESEDKTKKRNEELQIKVLKSNIHYKERTPIENFKHSKGFTMLKDLSSGGSGRYYQRCSIAGIMKTCGVDRYDADKLFREFDGYGGKFDETTLDKLYN